MTMRERVIGPGSIVGKQIFEAGFDGETVGEVGPLRRADKAMLEYVRRHAPEIPERDLLRQDDGHFLNKKTREVLEPVVELVEWTAEVEDRGNVTCFAILGGYLVALRPVGHASRVKAKARVFGVVGGREAKPDDPLPAGEWTIY